MKTAFVLGGRLSFSNTKIQHYVLSVGLSPDALSEAEYPERLETFLGLF